MDADKVRQVALEAQGDRGGGLKRATAALRDQPPAWAAQVRDFAKGSDLITGGIGGSVLGEAAAASLGVPWVRAELQPIGTIDGRQPGVFAAAIPPALGVVGNVVGQLATEAMIRVPVGGARLIARQALGVRRRPSVPGIVFGISPAVMNPPRVLGRPSLAAGYWFDRATPHALPALVSEFIADGGPVVSVGFGSMVSADPAATRDLLLGAIRDVGARAILVVGAGAMAASDQEGVLTVSSADYRALFPRMAATIHHGGAGTTAQAFASGVPTVILPFGADQAFWARRAAELGVAPRTATLAASTRDGLGRALDEALSNPTMRERARSLGSVISAEDGVSAAVDWYDTLRW